MKAVIYEQNGGPEVLKVVDVEKPAPGEGEALVRVAATSYNPVDAAYRGGMFPIPLPLPASPGSELSGTVAELGAGVSNVAVGDEVIAELLPAQGGAAEYVAVPAANLVPAPETMDLADAAGVPLVTQTAWQGLFDHAKVAEGTRVLVVGAGGSVGGVAVQLARRAGAHVIATATGADIECVKGYGADEVVDYKAQDVAEAIAEPVDAAVVFAPAPLAPYYPVIKEGGVLVSAASPADDAPDTIEVVRLFGQNDPAQLAEIVRLIDAGELVVPIAQRLTLDDVPAVRTLRSRRVSRRARRRRPPAPRGSRRPGRPAPSRRSRTGTDWPRVVG